MENDVCLVLSYIHNRISSFFFSCQSSSDENVKHIKRRETVERLTQKKNDASIRPVRSREKFLQTFVIMRPSAISMPVTANKSRNEMTRVKSQPTGGYRSTSFSTSISSPASPMKNLIGNLLHLTPYRHASPFNTAANRSKICSSLSTTIPSDRSSRFKLGHQSVASSFSIRSTILQSPRENRVNAFDNVTIRSVLVSFLSSRQLRN